MLLNLGFQSQSPEVECDELCQKVIQQRIADGLADDAPVATDVATFSCTEPVDGFLAGFPCQAQQHGQSFDIIEGSLEVKFPTIWTDEKKRWEESERREE